MKRTLPRLILIFLWLSSITQALAQNNDNVYTIDLSEGIDGSNKLTVASNVYFKLRFVNKLPGANSKYQYTVIKRNIPTQVLDIPNDVAQVQAKIAAEDTLCLQLKTKIEKLLAIKDEEELPGPIRKLEKDIEDIKKKLSSYDESIQNCLKIRIEEAENVIQSTRSETDPFILKNGEELIVTVSRKLDNSTRTWTTTYTTQPRGSWQVSYGFSVIPELLSQEGRYYAKEDQGSYKITEEHNRRWMSYAPSIFFTWLPYEKEFQDGYWNWSAGLGYDFENPTIFLGFHYSYNQNLKMHLGIVAHKQQQLLGKYNKGDVISENLAESQLHESLYRFNPFLSLSLRLSKAPNSPATGNQ